MPEYLIPFRSQSHSLNEFHRQVTGDIYSLYERHNQLEADIGMIASAARVQESAVASKVQELKSRLDIPFRLPGGLWKHQIAATTLIPDANGLVLPGYGIATVKTDTEKSRLTINTSDGTAIIPQALKVEVSPDTRKCDTETSPLYAIQGGKPWWRQVVAGRETGSAIVTYTVHLPVEVLDDPVANQIKIITFPLYTVTVESVEYLDKSVWRAVDMLGLEDNGMILLPLPAEKARAMRVTLRQMVPQYFQGKLVYHIGLSLFDVEMVVPGKEKATFTTSVNLMGTAPWKIERVELSPDLPDNTEWEISSGNVTIKTHELPADITDNRVKITVTMTAGSQLYRPILKHIELYYTDGSAGY